MRFGIPTRLEFARVLPQAVSFRLGRADRAMALRDIFKFRELPESETSKPFLEHLSARRSSMSIRVAALLLFRVLGLLGCGFLGFGVTRLLGCWVAGLLGCC